MEQETATELTADAAEKQKSPETAADGAEMPQASTGDAAEQLTAPDAVEAQTAPADDASEKSQTPAPEAPAPKPSAPQPSPHLENWSSNERMRHIPPVTWIADKVDHDVRQRLEILSAVLASLPSADPRYAPIEQALRGVCNALDLLAQAARHSRAATPPNELANRVNWSLNAAVSSVRAIDANNFGRRYPFHTADRSKAESVYAGLLVVLERVDRAVTLVREVDVAIDERLLQGLVNLQTPMRQEKIA